MVSRAITLVALCSAYTVPPGSSLPAPRSFAQVEMSDQHTLCSSSSSRAAAAAASSDRIHLALMLRHDGRSAVDGGCALGGRAGRIGWSATEPFGFDEAAMRKAFNGGLTGSIAGVAQVLLFMWLRTTMNYQYQYGGTAVSVMGKLWKEGGVPRLYRGLPYALVQGPLSRIGLRDANVMGLGSYPVFMVTLLGSILTAMYRVVLMPIDVLKTVSQVEGRQGYKDLFSLAFKQGKVWVLYTGAAAMASATLIGHYPWFLTFNVLDRVLEKPAADEALRRATRLAVIGFMSSVVSDVVSNPIRVLKTSRQAKAARVYTDADAESVTYRGIVRNILTTEGPQAFFTRGLSTRIFTNGLQSIVFTVIWGSLRKEN